MDDTNLYPCHGFHKSLPKGKASGRLSVSESLFHVEIGGTSLQLPLDGSVLTLGGASDRLVFISHPSKPEWRIYTSDRSILKNPNIVAHPELAPAAKSARSKRINGWLLLATVCLLVVASPILLLSKMDWLTHIVAKKVPAEWEQQLGESSMAQYKLGINMMEQEQAQTLLAPLTSPLIQALETTPYNFQFYIAEDSTPNAFALPGGFVVIHSGLILRSESPEQLLGVLAHEIAHVTQQHGLRNVIGTAGFYVIVSAVLGDASGLLATVASAAPFLLSQQYSRKFERQADEHGHALLLAARINPKGLAEFFEILLKQEQKQLDQIEDEKTRDTVKEALKFLSTHPTSEERIEYLRAIPVTSTNFINLEQEFSQLQQAVKNFTELNSEEEELNMTNEEPADAS